MRLNTAQQEAVSYTQGPCLVLAGAGSGKTRVITSKIVNLYRNAQIPPNRICALTFTNKAAGEMRERVAQELGPEIAGKVWISTFHSLGLEILKIEHRALNLPRSFTLFDEKDVYRVIRELLRNEYPELTDVPGGEKEAISSATAMISNWKSQLLAPEDLIGDGPNVRLYKSYCSYLKACHTVDFEDLIFLTTRLLNSNEQLRQKWAACFEYVLVDEYQDTNETQYQLLKVLVSKFKRFTVVGDDDQSIYSWRGARPENLKLLSQDFPNLKVIKLEQNYRSQSRILNCANELISHNPHLYEKTLFSELPPEDTIKIISCDSDEQEGLLVAALISGFKYRLPLKWRDFAILYRSNAQSRTIERVLHESRIPCFISGGSSFFDYQEVKDIMAYCRLVSNLKDNGAFLRIINVPRRGIGEQTLEAITSTAAKYSISNFEACVHPALQNILQKSQRDAVGHFVITMQKLRQLLIQKKDSYLAESLPKLINYEHYLLQSLGTAKDGGRKKNAAVDFKMRNVEMLLSWIKELIAGRRGEAALSFAQAVEKLGLREIQQRNSDEDGEDAVQLMTLHSSKGLEFPYVFLIGCEERILPHKNSLDAAGGKLGLEEERRLAYVGITRAQRFLCISWCKLRKNRDSYNQQQPSRFLSELPKDDIRTFEASNILHRNTEEHKLTNLSMAVQQLNNLRSSK